MSAVAMSSFMICIWFGVSFVVIRQIVLAFVKLKFAYKRLTSMRLLDFFGSHFPGLFVIVRKVKALPKILEWFGFGKVGNRNLSV